VQLVGKQIYNLAVYPERHLKALDYVVPIDNEQTFHQHNFLCFYVCSITLGPSKCCDSPWWNVPLRAIWVEDILNFRYELLLDTE